MSNPRRLQKPIAFYGLLCSLTRRYQVMVTLDLQERFIFMSSGILPDVIDSIDEFVSQLSELASCQIPHAQGDVACNSSSAQTK
ncbi:hypothetical protein [Phormidesmis priestleyi]